MITLKSISNVEENIMKTLTVALLVISSLMLSGCNKKESAKEQGVLTIKSEEMTSSTSTEVI